MGTLPHAFNIIGKSCIKIVSVGLCKKVAQLFSRVLLGWLGTSWGQGNENEKINQLQPLCVPWLLVILIFNRPTSYARGCYINTVVIKSLNNY